MKKVRYIHVNVFEQLKHVFIFIKPQTAQCVRYYTALVLMVPQTMSERMDSFS